MVRVYKVGRITEWEGDTYAMPDNGVFEKNLLDKSYYLDQGHFTKDWQDVWGQ